MSRATIGVLVLLWTVPLIAEASPSWSDLFVSSSPESVVSTGAPWAGERTLYLLWSTYAPGSYYQRLQFSFGGSLVVLEVTPLKGLVNEGTTSAPDLVAPPTITAAHTGARLRSGIGVVESAARPSFGFRGARS